MRARDAAAVLIAIAAGTVAGRSLAAADEVRLAGWATFWATLVENWLYRADDLRRIEAKVDRLLVLTPGGAP